MEIGIRPEIRNAVWKRKPRQLKNYNTPNFNKLL